MKTKILFLLLLFFLFGCTDKYYTVLESYKIIGSNSVITITVIESKEKEIIVNCECELYEVAQKWRYVKRHAYLVRWEGVE